jgi:hypothetical protein
LAAEMFETTEKDAIGVNSSVNVGAGVLAGFERLRRDAAFCSGK